MNAGRKTKTCSLIANEEAEVTVFNCSFRISHSHSSIAFTLINARFQFFQKNGFRKFRFRTYILMFLIGMVFN